MARGRLIVQLEQSCKSDWVGLFYRPDLNCRWIFNRAVIVQVWQHDHFSRKSHTLQFVRELGRRIRM